MFRWDGQLNFQQLNACFILISNHVINNTLNDKNKCTFNQIFIFWSFRNTYLTNILYINQFIIIVFKNEEKEMKPETKTYKSDDNTLIKRHRDQMTSTRDWDSNMSTKEQRSQWDGNTSMTHQYIIETSTCH